MPAELAPQPVPWIAAGRSRPRVMLLGNGDKPHVMEEADTLRPFIAQHADVVLIDFHGAHDLAQVDADMAIVLGGDGSILRAAKQMGLNQLPVLGVNLGRLGFLADVSPAELRRGLAAVCAGQCTIVSHLMLQCTILRNGEVHRQAVGLNEAAVLGGSPFSILHIDLYVDADHVTTYNCDGLIISTPVGSTAHNLSAGGPILRKDLRAFVISPISPHTLTVRPVVDSADRVFEMVVDQPNESSAVVVDGVALSPLTADDRVRVEKAQPEFKMIEPTDRNYYRNLREKLGWRGNLRHQP